MRPPRRPAWTNPTVPAENSGVDLESVLDTRAVVAGQSLDGTRTVAPRGADPSACFRIASLTKAFTAITLVRTCNAHDIPLSTPAVALLPALAQDWRADPAITVEQLLGQVSGLCESVEGTDVAT